MSFLKVDGGTWEITFRYYVQGKKQIEFDDIDTLLSSNNADSMRALLSAQLQNLQNALMKGTPSLYSTLFLDAMQSWLDDIMVSQVRYNTLIQYKRAFDFHIKTYAPFQDLSLGELTPQLLQQFYNTKVQEGLSPNTVHKLHANIHKFLKYATSLDMISLNPADKVTLPKKARSNVGKAYTAQQLQQLIDLFRNDELELVVYLTAVYGLRRSEVCGLRWDAVDLDKGRIVIRHTAVVINGEVIRADHTKSQSSQRTLPMSDQVKYILEIENQKASELFGHSGYVCTRPDGQPIDPNFVSHHFARVLRKSDLPYIRFHDIRHSVASLLHECDHDLRDIKEWLGHSDIATTGNIYSHLDQRRMQSMADAITLALNQHLS